MDTLWTHRGILWLQAVLDGEVLIPAGNGDAYTMTSGAVAVHGHNFRTDSFEDVAENIAEVLNSSFGDVITVSPGPGEGEFTVSLSEENAGRLEIREYLGQEDER
ncbi:MAG: hypothetical protein HUJ65_00925 [Oscillospiraceae bacterium]|nr:hypothetical protein [Oscillospiraceae bacterium]